MKFDALFKSDIGMKRKQNQDNGVSRPELGLFVVADGMGGHQGGETASKMVAEILPEYIAHKLENADQDPRSVIARAVEKANREIYQKSAELNHLNGMGTTTTAILIQKSLVTIGHVGDSRCYYFQPGAMWQLTRDHSLVAEKLRAGLISPEEARRDTMKNVITRSVGFEPSVEVDTYELECKVGDVFLLCSDGLTGCVEDDEIQDILEETVFKTDKNGKAVENAVSALIDRANKNGGDDNISVLIVRVTE